MRPSAIDRAGVERYRLVPWLLALVGLALPLALGGGDGWPYVVFWLVLLAALWFIRPLAGSSHRHRVGWAAASMVLLVFPGLIVGGWYLLPAAFAWLAIELWSADHAQVRS